MLLPLFSPKCGVDLGRVLKSIQEETGTFINLPRRENGALDAVPSSSSSIQETDLDEVMIAVSITGDASGCAMARSRIATIVAERATKTVRRISQADVPREYWPLLCGPRGATLDELIRRVGADNPEGAPGEGASVYVPPRGAMRHHVSASPMSGNEEVVEDDVAKPEEAKKREIDIVVTGERGAVERVVDAIMATSADLVSALFYQAHRKSLTCSFSETDDSKTPNLPA